MDRISVDDGTVNAAELIVSNKFIIFIMSGCCATFGDGGCTGSCSGCNGWCNGGDDDDDDDDDDVLVVLCV